MTTPKSSKVSDEIVDNMLRDIFLSVSMLRSLFNHVHGHPENISKCREFNLPPSNYFLLVMLKNKKTATMSEICNLLCISKSNLTAIIDSMIEKKLVKREYDKNDRRIIRIELTEKGGEIMEKAKIFVKQELKKEFEKLSETDMNNLYKSFKTIKEIFSKIK
jgi:DNA-binding MarR family transcriptional regulator